MIKLELDCGKTAELEEKTGLSHLELRELNKLARVYILEEDERKGALKNAVAFQICGFDTFRNHKKRIEQKNNFMLFHFQGHMQNKLESEAIDSIFQNCEDCDDETWIDWYYKYESNILRAFTGCCGYNFDKSEFYHDDKKATCQCLTYNILEKAEPMKLYKCQIESYFNKPHLSQCSIMVALHRDTFFSCCFIDPLTGKQQKYIEFKNRVSDFCDVEKFCTGFISNFYKVLSFENFEEKRK